ncbi:MAG: sulfotransferase [Alphaproteobacteria bacterium]|nr:sulfotransferase [Alphaproteobacteria bacterium]
MTRAPDFFLIGAMRAGTTTLHHTLGSHPDVFLPDAEQFFFDGDDFVEHAEDFRGPDGRWRPVRFDDPARRTRWHAAFDGAGDARVVGEDSTTYLTSTKAPARIAAELPDARIVVSLRDPVARAWSHYWHMVRSGRMLLRFEDALLSQRGTLLHRSRYAPALRRWLKHVPRERLHVLIFESFVADPQAELDRLSAFLGLDPPLRHAALPADTRHRHQARLPARPALQQAASFLRRLPAPWRPLPLIADPTRRGPRGPAVRLLEALAGREVRQGTPDMHPETMALLQGVLGDDNAGLDSLIGQPLQPWWPWFEDGRPV